MTPPERTLPPLLTHVQGTKPTDCQCLCVHVPPSWGMAPQFIEPPEYKPCVSSPGAVQRDAVSLLPIKLLYHGVSSSEQRGRMNLWFMPLYRDVASSSPSLLPQIAQIVSSRSNNLSHQISPLLSVWEGNQPWSTQTSKW